MQQDILLDQTEDGSTKIQVHLTDNTVWLTQAAMVELFQSSKSNISPLLASPPTTIRWNE